MQAIIAGTGAFIIVGVRYFFTHVTMNIYDIRRYGVAAFLMISLAMVFVFLYVSNNLVKDLSAQERERMQVWADATREILISHSDDIDFLLQIINSNNTIPVLLVDDNDNILDQRNFDLPEPVDNTAMGPLSEANREYLAEKLGELKESPNVIHIVIAPGSDQHLYYEDSKMLKRLSYFPYIQLLVMLVFILVVYYAVASTKKAEQNKVWVGLSKETAHQLGTPISSLMAWLELLRDSPGVDPDTIAEMDKDVERLSTIASRFGKVGSRPALAAVDLRDVVNHACGYMSSRISSRIRLTVDVCDRPVPVSASAPLFEWVMENLIKNAVDAMDGEGDIHVSVTCRGNSARVTVSDTGKGISRKRQNTIFNPGYTTKKRGWGLGLTLARRIIKEYHGGSIHVQASVQAPAAGHGTTFAIDIPLSRDGQR